MTLVVSALFALETAPPRPALLPDRGLFSELLPRVALAPLGAPLARPRARVDAAHGLVTIYDGEDPLTVVPASDLAALPTGAREALGPAPSIVAGAPGRGEDTDGDGIVDRLDILVGAKKLLANGARYIERYVTLRYPGGDVPRTEGVCTDTVIRALRNAGIDLQREVHEDILAAPRAYPMVEKVDASINHRRVRTVVVWFGRHFERVPAGAPYRPGEIVFFDTFPSKSGPDHLGVVSDRLGPSGLPLVINNWTDGATDAEMDLLSWVPVTDRFRAPLRRR